MRSMSGGAGEADVVGIHKLNSQVNVAWPLCLTPMGGGRRRPASGRSVVDDPVFNTQPGVVHKVRFVVGDQCHP